MTNAAAYVELHCHSYFSLLDGASAPEDLLRRAAELGMPALALTDHDAVYGAVRFAAAAQAAGIKPLFGAELTLADGSHLTLLARDSAGWRSLCTLITLARHHAPKGTAALPADALAAHSAGLIALSGCRLGAIPTALRRGDPDGARRLARHYRDLFGREGCWIELQQHLLPGDNALNAALAELAAEIGVGIVATNNVHYALPDAQPLQDVLVCIRHNSTLEDTPLRPNAEYYLKSGDDLAPLFAAYPQALANSRRIAAQCDLRLHHGLQSLPVFPTPPGMTTADYLRHLCELGLGWRGLADTPRAQEQLDAELAVIERAGLANYFLVVRDLVRFAREQDILCQGRGSAANSLVAYLLGISPVNPLAHDLVFERFLSDERQVTPDIDMDFDAARREEVIQYVYGRYGHTHAAMACTFVTFRARSALRDVGKALGLPPELLDHATATLDTYSAQALADSPALSAALGGRLLAHTWQQAFALCAQIDGLPRHLGIHNGGMVITGAPVTDYVPVEPASMPDRYVVQWDKEGLEAAGLIKIDLLGLRMLSAVAETVALVEHSSGIRPDLEALPFDDPAVYDLLCAADTVGVFQVESRAQAQVLPRLRPRQFNDLIVSISLIRPGPVQGDMVHPYLRRRLGEEPVSYPHPRLAAALAETLGVILFQEQVLKVARDLAGFTPGQGELLRRALGAKDAEARIAHLRGAFVSGAVQQGVAAAAAEAVFTRLQAFGGYAFPKSHAAAFAVLVYWSAWLKVYHPAAFYTALLNNQPMGFWSPAVLVNDARRSGLQVLAVDVNASQSRCTLEQGAIRLGFNYVKGMGSAAGEQIAAARGEQPFGDLADFCRRTRLPRLLVEHLIQAGACDAWGSSRRTLLWTLGALGAVPDALGLVYDPEPVALPELSAAEAAGMEYAVTGLSLGAHPLTVYRERLRARGVLDSAALRAAADGQQVQVAGLLVVHQAPPTAKGHHFLTLEDEHGFINVILRPRVYARYRRVVRSTPLLLVSGQVQQRGAVVNVIARHVRGVAE